MDGRIKRTWSEEFSAERAADFDLPRSANHTLADTSDGEYGLVVAGPYETPEDAEIAGRMLQRGETPVGACI
jgi:hypothetical protein